jgi:hypothetical protein
MIDNSWILLLKFFESPSTSTLDLGLDLIYALVLAEFAPSSRANRASGGSLRPSSAPSRPGPGGLGPPKSGGRKPSCRPKPAQRRSDYRLRCPPPGRPVSLAANLVDSLTFFAHYHFIMITSSLL